MIRLFGAGTLRWINSPGGRIGTDTDLPARPGDLLHGFIMSRSADQPTLPP
ncbi:MAG: hypothetical protein JSR21_05485 [Proteobacteria bacterium]|nr:hypothetical protein [Pseudomonadota bacterium]